MTELTPEQQQILRTVANFGPDGGTPPAGTRLQPLIELAHAGPIRATQPTSGRVIVFVTPAGLSALEAQE